VVYVGAGAADLDAAREADFAVARDALADAMEAAGLPHYTFDTFGDVARSIIEIGKLPSA
jgi:2-hydroxy-3-keto-5-methylthiopentenyl-1-phosphate phosphatase